jgi:hypothetical protein
MTPWFDVPVCVRVNVCPPPHLDQVGLRRLDSVHELLQAVVAAGTPGDFIEAGSWRGGVVLFATALFKVGRHKPAQRRGGGGRQPSWLDVI